MLWREPFSQNLGVEKKMSAEECEVVRGILLEYNIQIFSCFLEPLVLDDIGVLSGKVKG